VEVSGQTTIWPRLHCGYCTTIYHLAGSFPPRRSPVGRHFRGLPPRSTRPKTQKGDHQTRPPFLL